jgi:hypothetical protein
MNRPKGKIAVVKGACRIRVTAVISARAELSARFPSAVHSNLPSHAPWRAPKSLRVRRLEARSKSGPFWHALR